MIDPKFKDVKAGDWIWTIQETWERVRSSIGSMYPIKGRNETYTPQGLQSSTDKCPSAWTYNPFDSTDKPPCEFKKGEVIVVSDYPSLSKSNSRFLPFTEMIGNTWFSAGGNAWSYARKLTPEEKGE